MTEQTCPFFNRGSPRDVETELKNERDFPATLLAMAGHDLRQPLQIITSAHDVLARALSDVEQREELARAEDATSQLGAMLGQLVEALQLHELARDERGKAVSLRPILHSLTSEFTERARLKNVTLSILQTRATVLSHSVLLTGMLRNLVRNAIDYTPPGGKVIVACRRCGPDLRIEVRDSGIGIRADILSRIFTAFERGDETSSDGLGLGLFIAKRAADLLNHRIEVRSAVGRGSYFAVVARAAVNPLSSLSRGQFVARRTMAAPRLSPISRADESSATKYSAACVP
jgi:two-component system phosphate regulon sensor histidine kinase PhoR